MELSTRTLISSALQTSQIMGLPYIVQPHTTLNEKFNINPNLGIAAGQVPDLAYFCIGNGGHQFTVGANNIPKPEPVQHIATDAALFNHLPFVMRTLDNDLDSVTMANYALRTVVTLNNKQYATYYAKRISFAGVVPQMQLVTVQNGVSTAAPFVYTSANLNPTPQTLSGSGVNTVTGNYATASALVPLTLAAFDVAELLNVANILYSDPSYAIISEIALCSGVDKVVTGQGNNNTSFTYTDAIAVQVLEFVNTFFAAEFNNQGITLSLALGSSEPLFSLS